MKKIIRKIKGISLMIFAFSLVIGSNAEAQTCGLQPSCEELGYTQTSSDCTSQEHALKCPFDHTKLFCGDCGGAGSGESLNLEVGAIVYSDKTVSKEVISGKIPIGVVADAEKKLVIALEDAPNALKWGPYGKDISLLPNCEDHVKLGPCHTDTDGKYSTTVIIYYGKGNNIEYPAAEYCNNYTTAGTSAGDWFLPSRAELKAIFNNKNAIDTTLSLLGKDSYSSRFYWSSTEYNEHLSWVYDMIDGGNALTAKNESILVRPVLTL